MSTNSTNTPESICSSCAKPSPKKIYNCGVCQNFLCKDCTQFLDESFFSFLKNIPDELKHGTYCGACYDQKIQPAKETYLETMRRAKNIIIFDKKATQIPLIERARFKVAIDDCSDRKETILRLAFLAAEQSYNAVIEVEISSKKIRNAGYQKSSWSGTGFLAQIRTEGLKAVGSVSWK